MKTLVPMVAINTCPGHMLCILLIVLKVIFYTVQLTIIENNSSFHLSYLQGILYCFLFDLPFKVDLPSKYEMTLLSWVSFVISASSYTLYLKIAITFSAMRKLVALLTL